jgi:uncharacterized membrane protein
MALDHVRDYFSNFHANAWMDLQHGSTPVMFLTRWITHFCAPAFCFLAGVGAALSFSRGKSKGELSRFLLTRGAFLVLLDLTVIRVAWDFNLQFSGGPWFIVLAVLGFSMIALAGLVWLPSWAIVFFAVVVIGGHNLFDFVDDLSERGRLGRWSPLWTFLHMQTGDRLTFPPLNRLRIGGGPGIPFYISYPLIPWIGVMALGYAFGPIFRLPGPDRRRRLIGMGIALIVAFVVLRGSCDYGDPRPWEAESPYPLYNALEFLRTSKYPPSLDYLLMTLGPILIALALLDQAKGFIAGIFLDFGRVPLFFYVAHLYVIHGLAVACGMMQGFPAREMMTTYNGLPDDYGFSLRVVYGVWLLVLLVLYPPCAWFSNLKRRSKHWLLSYL